MRTKHILGGLLGMHVHFIESLSLDRSYVTRAVTSSTCRAFHSSYENQTILPTNAAYEEQRRAHW